MHTCVSVSADACDVQKKVPDPWSCCELPVLRARNQQVLLTHLLSSTKTLAFKERPAPPPAVLRKSSKRGLVAGITHFTLTVLDLFQMAQQVKRPAAHRIHVPVAGPRTQDSIPRTHMVKGEKQSPEGAP